MTVRPAFTQRHRARDFASELHWIERVGRYHADAGDGVPLVTRRHFALWYADPFVQEWLAAEQERESQQAARRSKLEMPEQQPPW